MQLDGLFNVVGILHGEAEDVGGNLNSISMRTIIRIIIRIIIKIITAPIRKQKRLP